MNPLGEFVASRPDLCRLASADDWCRLVAEYTGQFLDLSERAEFCAANVWWVVKAANDDDPDLAKEMLRELQRQSDGTLVLLHQWRDELAIVADGPVDVFGDGQLVCASAHEGAIEMERLLRLRVLSITGAGRNAEAPIDDDCFWPLARAEIVRLPATQHSRLRACVERERAKVLDRLNGHIPTAEAAKLATGEVVAGQVSESKMPDLAADGNRWTSPDSPKRWGKVFACHARTFVRRVNRGAIRAKKLSDKSYQVHVDDLPSGQK